MAQFKVTLKRIAYAEVVIEAATQEDAKRLLADDDTAFEYFTSSGNAWYGPEIKVQRIQREPVRS
jgi:hypothetical protein